MPYQLRAETKEQIAQCIHLLKAVLGKDLLGVYLYASSIVGGLQKYSDIDLFVVSDRSTTHEEKIKLVRSLLHISGVHMKSSTLPIELTITVKSEINPWHYLPHFDFQYGDWLRKEFEKGNIEPWKTKKIADLALLITQVLLASKTLLGANPDQLLCSVPYRDFMIATIEAMNSLMLDLYRDTRNVLLTLARIWSTVKTDAIRTKADAATWALHRLPEKYQPVMKRARAIYRGEENEYWDDIKDLIEPCATYIVNQINEQIPLIESSDNANKSITLG